MDWIEKRKYKRIDFRSSVEYLGKNFWNISESRNISAGGIFVATHKVELPQAELELMFKFELKEKKFIYAEGKIVWYRPKDVRDEVGNIKPAGIGIEFVRLHPIAKEHINQAIKEMD